MQEEIWRIGAEDTAGLHEAGIYLSLHSIIEAAVTGRSNPQSE